MFPSTTAALRTIGLLLPFGLFSCTGATQSTSPSASAEKASNSVKQPATQKRKAPEERSVYRFDITISSVDSVKHLTTSSNHSLILEESTPGELRIGQNVPLTVSGNVSARQDVGLLLRGIFNPVGQDLLMDLTVEMSSLEDGAAIRKTVIRSDALLSPNTPSVVSSTEDPTNHNTLAVTMSAAKLR